MKKQRLNFNPCNVMRVASRVLQRLAVCAWLNRQRNCAIYEAILILVP